MKLEDIIWDIKHMLMALSEGTTVLEGDLIDKIAFYRMGYIMRYWKANQQVLEEWFQFAGNFTSEDWNIFTVEGIITVKGGQISIPKVVSFPNDVGMRLNVLNSIQAIYPSDYNILITMLEILDPRTSMFKFYAHRHAKIYTYPKYDFALNAILQEPTEAKIEIPIMNALNGSLENEINYKIISGNIDYDGKSYVVGTIFKGTMTQTWTNTYIAPVILAKVSTDALVEGKSYYIINGGFAGTVSGITTNYVTGEIFEYHYTGTPWQMMIGTTKAIIVDVSEEMFEQDEFILLDGRISYTDWHMNTMIAEKGDEFSGAIGFWTAIPQIAIIQTSGIQEFTYFDEYPLDVEGAQSIILEILTKDYQIRMKSISDTIQDDQDQFKVLSSK